MWVVAAAGCSLPWQSAGFPGLGSILMPVTSGAVVAWRRRRWINCQNYSIWSTLHHLDAPQRFPENARSVLRPEGVLLIVDWIEGARTGIPEGYLALQTVVRWVREAGFQLLREKVRGQSMVIVAKL